MVRARLVKVAKLTGASWEHTVEHNAIEAVELLAESLEIRQDALLRKAMEVTQKQKVLRATNTVRHMET